MNDGREIKVIITDGTYIIYMNNIIKKLFTFIIIFLAATSHLCNNNTLLCDNSPLAFSNVFLKVQVMLWSFEIVTFILIKHL